MGLNDARSVIEIFRLKTTLLLILGYATLRSWTFESTGIN